MREGLPLLDPVEYGVDAWNCCSLFAMMREANLRTKAQETEYQAKKVTRRGGAQSPDYTVSGAAIAFALASCGNTFPHCFYIS